MLMFKKSIPVVFVVVFTTWFSTNATTASRLSLPQNTDSCVHITAPVEGQSIPCSEPGGQPCVTIYAEQGDCPVTFTEVRFQWSPDASDPWYTIDDVIGSGPWTTCWDNSNTGLEDGDTVYFRVIAHDEYYMADTSSIVRVFVDCQSSEAQCPEDTSDLGICDTMYYELWPPDASMIPWFGGACPYLARIPIYVTHDLSTSADSICGFSIPMCYTHTNPSKRCSLSNHWNYPGIINVDPAVDRSCFRHMPDMTTAIVRNRMMDLNSDFVSGWDFISLDLGDQVSQFFLTMVPSSPQDQAWWEGSKVLLTTMTFRLEDTMQICIDTCYPAPGSGLMFARFDLVGYVPRLGTPHSSSSYEVCFYCNIRSVIVTAGSDQSGFADSIVSVAFIVQNGGVSQDSFNLDITDTQGWSIEPSHYDIVLDSLESKPISFTVSIPYVPLGTVDELKLTAVSKTSPALRDSAYLNVTCNAYVENWLLTSGADLSGLSNSQVTGVFYVQNTGLVIDSCLLEVSDSLGWDIQPTDSYLILSPGQQDSVFFDIQIPAVPLGTTNKVMLNGQSLTNPYACDTASLKVTCESYNVTITSVSDVDNDQGKQVRVEWSSFPPSDPVVTEFSVFRRMDLLLEAPFAYPPGNWDWLITIPAFGETLYSAIVPTLKDSTISEGMHWSVFFIRAGTDDPIVYFDSPVDSGYSLDNLSPSPPTGLFASHEPAVTRLAWVGTPASDFDYYSIYRDTLEGFTPDLNNRVGYTIDTSLVDSTAELGRTYYYLASATDFSGNESDPSNEVVGVRYITGDITSDGVVDLGDVVGMLNYLFKGGSAPNPLEAGDVNCDGIVDLGDAIYLLNYLFKNGPPPCEP